MQALVFDCETSGLIENHTLKLEKQPHIIEFYGCGVDLSSGSILEETHLYIKPPKPIEEEITKITGITNEFLSDKPSFPEVADRVIIALETFPFVIAHNLSYDQEMVELELERLRKRVRWPTRICTVEQTIHLKGFRLSLSALHLLLFNETFADAHRAKVDTLALVRVCVELYKRELL